MTMRTSLVLVILHGLALLSACWRPDPGAENSTLEVAFGTQGQAHVLKDKSMPTKAKANFTNEEFNAAFDDHNTAMPAHMLDMSLFQSEENNQTRLQMFNDTVVPGHNGGQILRGVLDFGGYAFAISMDRQSWSKVQNKDGWFSSMKAEKWEAKGEMYLKLIRYPKDPKKQQTSERWRKNHHYFSKNTKVNSYIDKYLQAGWAGKLSLVGWWNDDSMHFRGKAACVNKEDEQWLQHALLPWSEIDLRFDNDGVQAKFDYYHDRSHLAVAGDVTLAIATVGLSKLFGANIGEKMGYRVFRLDGLPAGEDPKRTYQGMIFLRGVLYSWVLKLDDCKWDGKPIRKDGKWDPEKDRFQCIMEERPLLIMGKDKKQIEANYRKAPFGSSAPGQWFAAVGMVGENSLLFEKKVLEGVGTAYSALSMSSSCWGQSPCPFVLPATRDRVAFQFLAKSVQLQLEDDNGPVSGQLYPVWDEDIMSQDTDQSNTQGFDVNGMTNAPMITTKKDFEKANFGFEEKNPNIPQEVQDEVDDGEDNDGGESNSDPDAEPVVQQKKHKGEGGHGRGIPPAPHKQVSKHGQLPSDDEEISELKEKNDRQAQKIVATQAALAKAQEQRVKAEGRNQADTTADDGGSWNSDQLD